MLGQNDNQMAVSLTTIAQESDSHYPKASQQVITSTAEWVNLWQQHSSQPLPEVDTENQVVAVFASQKPTFSYSLEIINVETTNSQSAITVKYYHSKGDLQLPRLHPDHIVKYPRIPTKKLEISGIADLY